MNRNVHGRRRCMKEKLPSLDGWRAVSISLVLAAHCVFSGGFSRKLVPALEITGAGGLGVRCFFVISGFLITWLLVSEYEKAGRISLYKFYVRRALRIFPVYFTYLGVLAFFTHFRQSTPAWIGNVTYTTNFVGSGFSTFHLWSLGVEEQFYLLWPALLVLSVASRKNLWRILLIPLLIAPVVRLLYCKHWYPMQMDWLFQGYSFFSKFDSLAYGCIGSLLFFYQRERVESFYQRHSNLISWGAATLIVLPMALQQLHFPARLQAAMFDSMQATGFMALLLQSILYPDKGFFRALNWRWVRHIGVLSYSIYIWQQMFCGTKASVFSSESAWWIQFPMWIPVTLLVAHISYYLLERPFFSLREKFRV
jgi:peptidoglycan/LPS O-acetylase OafA/YrhL